MIAWAGTGWGLIALAVAGFSFLGLICGGGHAIFG